MERVDFANLTQAERGLLESVDRGVADGVRLMKWMEDADASNSYARRFELTRVFNQPDSSFGFFGEVPCEGGTIPVMGEVQQMLYDRPKARREAWADQVREFVLHYFLRITAFREPETFSDSELRPVSADSPLSWCQTPRPQFGGFGYQQLFYKRSDTGEIGRFTDEDRYAIVDLREIEEKYAWILGKVRIFNFSLSFAPLGPDMPQLDVPLNEETFLVVTPDFVVNESHSEMKRYGVGYALLDNPGPPGALVYGPGRFGAGFQSIHFHVREDGDIFVRMGFVVNRPRHILNLAIDPVNFGFNVADLVSCGLATAAFAPVREALEKVIPRMDGFDPVFGYISLVNLLAGPKMAEDLCISREHLEKEMLAQHFKQHYNMIVSSLLTWRQIPDWLDDAGLPTWVVRGIST